MSLEQHGLSIEGSICSELYEVGVGKCGKMEWGGEGQFTSNLGPGWTRIAPRKEEGFQVRRRESGERGVVKGNQQGESARGIGKGN